MESLVGHLHIDAEMPSDTFRITKYQVIVSRIISFGIAQRKCIEKTIF